MLTEPDVEHSCGCDDPDRVTGHTLVVACVGGVQVLDTQLGAAIGLADGDAALLLHDGCIVLQPADAGLRVARYFAMQRCRQALHEGDVVWLL